MNITHYWVAFYPCGKCLSGFSADEHEQLRDLDIDRADEDRVEDWAMTGVMLMLALREGRKVAYLAADEAKQIPMGCRCSPGSAEWSRP